MTRLRSIIKEVLSTPPKKKDCNCGCGGCDKKAPIITEGRIKKAISEGLTYHVENKIPLHESVYRIGSEKHFALINEARKLWVRGLIDVSEDDQAILETHLGNFGMYEGEKVPLDMPMINEETTFPDSFTVKDTLHYTPEIDGKPKKLLKGTYFLRNSQGDTAVYFNQAFKSEVEIDNDDIFNFKRLKSNIKIDEGFYFQPSDMEDSGLNVTPKDQRHASKMVSALEDSGLHAEWNAREGYFFFPEEEDRYDQLEMEIQDLMDENNIQGYIEGVFEESLKEEDNRKHALLRVEPRNYEAMIDKLQDMNINHRRESDTVIKVYTDNISDRALYNLTHDVYVDKFVLKEVDRYSGFNRNPEDPDSAPFEPSSQRIKGKVDQFKEDLRALFGKFKGDLRNPDFIRGVAEIMVSWKSLLRSQLNEGQDKWVVYDTKTKKRLPNAGKIYKDRKAAQAFADKQENAEVASDTFYFDKIQESLNEEKGYGADTAWKDEEGNKVTLEDILDMTKNIPQKDYPTEKLAKVVLNWDDNPKEVERIDQVEVSKQYPILIMVGEDEKIKWILDGNHRAQKALRSNSETIPAKLIKPSNLSSEAKKILLGVVDESLNEAKKKKKKDPPIGKPKRGGSKAYYVYIRDPKTKKIKKVSFGSGGLRAKIRNPKARKAFAARHKCSQKTDRTKPSYWSCRLPRYAKQLGLGANMNTFW